MWRLHKIFSQSRSTLALKTRGIWMWKMCIITLIKIDIVFVKNYAQNVLNLYILHQFENMFFPWKMNAIFAFQPFGKKQILWIFDVIFQKFEISLWSNFHKCNCFLPKGMTIKANIGFILHGNLRIFINGRFFEG